MARLPRRRIPDFLSACFHHPNKTMLLMYEINRKRRLDFKRSGRSLRSSDAMLLLLETFAEDAVSTFKGAIR
eukprot:2110739-Rhodomonas_salina.1